MDITFSDEKVRGLCCSSAGLARMFGIDLAKKICCRLSMLYAAPSLDHVPIPPPISLSLDGKGTFSVALGTTHHLLFRVPTLKSGRVDELSKISKIEIIGPAQVASAKEKAI